MSINKLSSFLRAQIWPALARRLALVLGLQTHRCTAMAVHHASEAGRREIVVREESDAEAEVVFRASCGSGGRHCTNVVTFRPGNQECRTPTGGKTSGTLRGPETVGFHR